MPILRHCMGLRSERPKKKNRKPHGSEILCRKSNPDVHSKQQQYQAEGPVARCAVVNIVT